MLPKLKTVLAEPLRRYRQGELIDIRCDYDPRTRQYRVAWTAHTGTCRLRHMLGEISTHTDAIEAARAAERSRRAWLRLIGPHCEGCNKPIPAKRLRAIPGAQFCVRCQPEVKRIGCEDAGEALAVGSELTFGDARGWA